MGRILILVAAVGAALLYAGVEELRLAGAAGAEPHELSCARLAEEGPGDDVHVTLTAFLLCDFAYVYEEENGTWHGAWVPAVPLGGAYHRRVLDLIGQGARPDALPAPEDVRVLVKLPRARGAGDVEAAAARATLDGMVVNEIESLGREERRILEESYPGVDFARCWILEVGRRPAGRAKLAGLLGGGATLLLLAAGVFLRGLRRERTRFVVHPEPARQESLPPLPERARA